jgi:uncharacterized protein YkwD
MSTTIATRDFAHAATVCATLETGLRVGISRTQRVIEEAQAELRHMIDLLNQGRAARGLPPLVI